MLQISQGTTNTYDLTSAVLLRLNGTSTNFDLISLLATNPPTTLTFNVEIYGANSVAAAKNYTFMLERTSAIGTSPSKYPEVVKTISFQNQTRFIMSFDVELVDSIENVTWRRYRLRCLSDDGGDNSVSVVVTVLRKDITDDSGRADVGSILGIPVTLTNNQIDVNAAQAGGETPIAIEDIAGTSKQNWQSS